MFTDPLAASDSPQRTSLSEGKPVQKARKATELNPARNGVIAQMLALSTLKDTTPAIREL